jgi:rare lipoprotein A (peptidoglycan hydrolase)
MVLFAASMLSYDFSPTNITPSAAGEIGIASVYSHESGSGTASGQKLEREALTAAHRTLPFGSKVKVTNKRNGRTVVVTIKPRPVPARPSDRCHSGGGAGSGILRTCTGDA